MKHHATLIVPERRRELRPPFAWLERRFVFKGYMAPLSAQEMLLYFFLVLVADRDGLSFYSYDKICQHLKMDVDDYLQARNGLLQKDLIAFDGRQFQILSLPATPAPKSAPPVHVLAAQRDAQALAEIMNQWANKNFMSPKS